MVRRRVEKRVSDDPDFYIASLSNLVIVYKGLCQPVDLPLFYPDLADYPDAVGDLSFSSAFFHQHPA